MDTTVQVVYPVSPTSALVITSIVWPDRLSDGELWFMARDPRFPGCLSDGATLDEARENLDDARCEFIQSMLEDGLPLPVGVNASEGVWR